jgi:kynurenine formamidase
MPQPPGMPEFACRTMRDVRTDRFNMQQLHVLTHHGTHVDAPFHFVPDGATIDELELDTLGGVGVVLDVPRAELAAIGPADLARARPSIRAGDIVLVRTGWSIQYESADYTRGPFLTPAAATYLLQRRIKLLGVDLISPDEPPHAGRAADFDYPVHRLLLGAGVPIVENLNLEVVRGNRCDVLALPIQIEGGDGGPARVVARPRRFRSSFKSGQQGG